MTIQQAVQLALQHQQAGRLREAEAIYRDILVRQPNQPDVLHLLGMVMSQTGRPDEALEHIRRAIAIYPKDASYHNSLALVLRSLGRRDEAIAAYQQAIALEPDAARVHMNHAKVLAELGRMEESLLGYRRALELEPNNAEAHNGLGVALASIGKHAQARDAFRNAIARAAAAAGAAQAGKPTADMIHNLGKTLAELGELDEAADAFRQAIALDPQHAEAHSGLAHVRWRTGLVDESLEDLRTAVRLAPQNRHFHSSLLFALQFSPRETAESILAEHRRFDERHARPLRSQIRPHANDRDQNRRLRIGCVSGDFRNHVQALYTIPLFTAHDRAQVELFCYSNVPEPDHVTEQMKGLADVWRDTARVSDERVADMIRSDAIDILVDHNMHMTFARPLIFARKPAPVQVAWLAYPGTTGLSAMDYRLTDPYLDPLGEDTSGKYTETSIHLPETFWCYDPMCDEPVAELPAARNGYVTFGCLNNFAKVNDGVLALWSRVLASVPNARLIMQTPAGSARKRVGAVLESHGVDSARVEFVGFLRRRNYLHTYTRIDIALDTVPYNGHTTSMDAMWMGVPVVTLVGPTVAGRAGWSQLNNFQLTELAAHDDAGFVRIATELAGDLPRVRALRQTLRERMRASPLIDAKRFARDMEAAFRTMWRRWRASPAGG